MVKQWVAKATWGGVRVGHLAVYSTTPTRVGMRVVKIPELLVAEDQSAPKLDPLDLELEVVLPVASQSSKSGLESLLEAKNLHLLRRREHIRLVRGLDRLLQPGAPPPLNYPSPGASPPSHPILRRVWVLEVKLSSLGLLPPGELQSIDQV